MSDKQFEPCTLTEATHVEVGGKTYKIGGYEVIAFCNSVKTRRLGINIMLDGWDVRTIRQELFPILGIKTFKEIKPEPIEFEHIFTFEEITLGIIPCEAEGKRFRCVEILEDEE
jgi:hypothetical protein